MNQPEIFSREVLQRIETETFVRGVEFHRELNSTNDLALELAARDDVELPLLVLAQKQTAGRGRGANQWWAETGALTFSLLFAADAAQLAKDRWPRISITAALAVCDVLAAQAPGHDVGLKWPNDVFFDGRKICGILAEIPPRRGGCVIVGIGINVNNSFDAAPAELRSIATSLFDTTWQQYDLPELLIELLQRFDDRFEMLCQDDDRLASDWQARCILRGRAVQLEVGQRQFAGQCQGIDKDGSLLLSTDSGLQRHVAGVVRQFS